MTNKKSFTIIGGDDRQLYLGECLLKNGYIVKILPISSLSSTDKSNHSTPPIYIIIADQYGIRKITINGEII